jgi:plastocyanin
MKRTRTTCIAALLIVTSLFIRTGNPVEGGPPEKPGSITGVVRHTGELPPPRKIMTTDGGFVHHSDHVVDAKSKGLRYLFVTLEGARPRPRAKGLQPVTVDQRDMVFVPRVVAVRHGQAVRFDNSDLCNHSVMAISKVESNAFNVFVQPNQPHTATFVTQDGPVLIGCSLHAWMRAWVYVVPHPWFAVTDEKGQFTLEGVPPGKHTLRLEHADTRTVHRLAVEVRAGKAVAVRVDWKDVKRGARK